MSARVRTLITREPLDPAGGAAWVREDGDGAVCVFVGHVRDRNDGAAVQRLDYEAYEAMLEPELIRIAEESLRQAGASRMLIAHRLGSLGVGEASVLIAAAAAHRGQAFDACRQAIELVKADAPIWKREHRGQQTLWVEPTQASAPTLSHVDADGAVRMVDVSAKPSSSRRAVAGATVRCQPETVRHIAEGGGRKGNVIETARLAGIMAAKRTADLIPLCHPLPLTHVSVDLALDPAVGRVRITAEVRCTGPTGVEMEALTAVTVAALTVIDMTKAVDRWMTIDNVRLLHKEGGRSGVLDRPDEEDGSVPPGSGNVGSLTQAD